MNPNSNSSNINIPDYNTASKAREAANITLALIEKTMSEAPQEFLRNGHWFLSLYNSGDLVIPENLPESTQKLANRWVRAVLNGLGWDFDFEKKRIFPFVISDSKDP